MDGQNAAASLSLVWHGPYQWFDTNGRSVFVADVASQYGLYLWTIRYQRSHLVYYVGETGASQSFRQRLNEHARMYLSGKYQIHEPSEFAAGRHKVIRPGSWKVEPGPEWPPFSVVRPQLYQLLDHLYLLLAPLRAETRIRKRIEGAVARATQRFPRPAKPKGGFQEADIRYVFRKPQEPPILVHMERPVAVLGLDPELIG